MIEWSQLTNDEIAALDRSIPVILPLGLIEAHGPHLATSVDSDTASYFSRRIAENTGAILLPVIHYGFADEMREYAGTLGVSIETMAAVIADISSLLCRHGFKRQIWLSGHGANKSAAELAIQRLWEKHPDLQACYWNYWTEAGFNTISHADKGETEIALVVGTRSHMDRAKDFKVQKPWYRIRSRATICPETGGINGQPTRADLHAGEAACEEIVRILTEKLRTIVASGQGGENASNPK